MEITPDTKQELTEGEYIKQMTESKGWQIVKANLDAKIIDLQMIGNVEGSTPQDKVTNMEARAMAVAILFQWLKGDVYGRVEQHENAKQALLEAPGSGFIERS